MGEGLLSAPLHKVEIKRIYEPADGGDGFRVLVDRVWPRGVKKETASIDLWLKEVAPSTELRRWFGHEPSRWSAFKERYARELAGNPALAKLEDALAHRRVTLLYAARDDVHNNAAALAEYLHGGTGKGHGPS